MEVWKEFEESISGNWSFGASVKLGNCCVLSSW